MSNVPASLIRGRYLVVTDEGGQLSVLRDAALYQESGTVIEIGDYEALRDKYAPDVVIGSGRELIVPGLVDAHHHIGLTPFQLGARDAPLELWQERMGAPVVDPYLDTLYSAFELIQSGVTTVQHIQGHMLGPFDSWPLQVAEVVRAYVDVGMRVSVSVNLRDQSFLVYGGDDEFIRGLPNKMAAVGREYVERQNVPLDDQLQCFFTDLKRLESERVRVQLAPANFHWMSDSGLLKVAEYAERHDTKMHMHLLETPYQKAYGSRRSSRGTVRHLLDMGILSNRLTLGHAVWVDDQDIEYLASNNVNVCHNASSNLRLHSGIAPIMKMIESGIRVALGIDEAGINDDRDMLQEMRLVSSLHRHPGHDTRVLDSAEVFAMASQVGAETTAFGRNVGVLAPGRRADMVLVDWDALSYPFLYPEVKVLDAFLYRGRADHVRTVVVDGSVVFEAGRFTKVDRDAVLAEISSHLNSMVGTEDQVTRRRFGEELRPYVRKFYAGWLES